MRLPSFPIERAKPLLGTIVRIRVGGLPLDVAQDVISGAFDLITDIHSLMSFHEAESELSHLNREASRRPIQVSPPTQAVLRRALDLAAASDGLFDPTVAPVLVEAGLLPPVVGAPAVHGGDWRDVSLSEGGMVEFGKPLWLDFGGIAKGYAVDRAFEYVAAHNPLCLCVEAGGDLRLSGPEPERVYLAASNHAAGIPVIEIVNAAVASSGSHVRDDFAAEAQLVSPHADPRRRRQCRTDRFATVVAHCCMDADALTKVVMAAGMESEQVIAGCRALAFMQDGDTWRSIGAGASHGMAIGCA